MLLRRPSSGVLLPVITLAFVGACTDANDVATAVTLTLESVDGAAIPARLTSVAGKPATIGRGFLQGTNWGHACGFSVGLAEGPLTFTEIPGCRLQPGEARTFTVTLLDSRFPAGSHTYRFIPQ
jgi:hypothetical protein